MLDPKDLMTPEEKEITRLRAQIASLVKDIKTAEALLTAGDDNGALVQVRLAASRASQSYLDCIGRDAVKPNAKLCGTPAQEER